MSNDDYQSLSAILDGEASEKELERVLSKIVTDQDLRTEWRRLCYGSDVLRGAAAEEEGQDLSSRVMRAVERESPPQRSSFRKLIIELLNPLGSFAVAASVTLVVVFFGQNLFNSEYFSETNYIGGVSPVSMNPIAGSIPRRASYLPGSTQQSMTFPKTGNKKLAYDQLRDYGLEHASRLSEHTVLGSFSYVRVPVEQD